MNNDMRFSCYKLLLAVSVFGLRMAVRYRFIILGLILGLGLMLSMFVTYDSRDVTIGNIGTYIYMNKEKNYFYER